MVAKASDVLGAELAMRALGVADRRTLTRWQQEGATIRALGTRTRVQAVFLIISELEQTVAPSQISAWFTAPNPSFGYRTALDMLTDDALEASLPEILASAAQ
jgi:hypothetical protein